MSFAAHDPDARRRKRLELEAQLRQLEEEDQMQRHQYSQVYRPASTSGASPALPSQPFSSVRDASAAVHSSSQGAGAGGWRSDQTPSASASSSSRHASAYPNHTAWESPVPAVASSSTQPRRPSQSETRQHRVATSRPPVTAPSSVPSGRAVPVPSEEQVHDYLITHMGQREGLYSGWEIHGHRFDVYALFRSVIQMGGSSPVSRQNQWNYIATMLRFPMPDQRIGLELREFFLRMLGGLEVLWEKTKTADEADRSKAQYRALKSQPSTEATRRQELSLASLTSNTVKTRPSWPPGQVTSDDRSDYLPTPKTSQFKGQHLQVRGLTRATTPPTSKSPRQGFPPQPGGSATQYMHQNNHAQSYAQPYRPTPSPVDEQLQCPASATLPGSQDSARASASSAIASQPAAGRVGAASALSVSNPGSRGQSNAAASSSSTRSMDYEPPTVLSFEHLVHSQALPPPPHGSGLVVPHLPGPYVQYAYRAHELRSSIRKMSAGEAHRQILPEEVLWWNKLVLLLQKNPKVVIPKPSISATPARPLSTDIPHHDDVSAPSTINPNSVHNLVQAPITSPSLPAPSATHAAGAQADPSSQLLDPKPKKRRGRPPKVAQAPAGSQAGQGKDDATITDSAPAPVAKRRGRPPKRKPNQELDHAESLLRQSKKQRLDAEGLVASTDQLGSALPTPVSASMDLERADQGHAAGALGLSSGLPSIANASTAGSSTIEQGPEPAAGFLRMVEGRQGPVPGLAHGGQSAEVGPSASVPVTLAAAEAQSDLNTAKGEASSTPGRVGANGRPTPSALSASRSKAAKARWDRTRAVIDTKDGGASSNLSTPTFVRAPSVVNSASPIRILDLSGKRMSQAQLTERDAKTPTKVLVNSKPSQPSRLSQSDTPTGANAALKGTIILAAEEEDAAFDPFVELSQSWSVPVPVKKDDVFVPYAPARKPIPRDAEEEMMPEEADIAALAAVLSTGLNGMDHGEMDAPDALGQEPDFEVLEHTPASQSRRKGKGKAAGQGKGDTTRLQNIELVQKVAMEQRVTRSTPPSRSVQKKPTARRTAPPSGVSRLTRSIGGPPSSALRTRHVTASPSQAAPKKKAQPVPKRVERSHSFIEILPPPRTKVKAPRRSMAQVQGPDEESVRTPRGAVDRAVVSIPITAGRRRRLILLGYHDAFRDDDSDGEEDALQRAHASLRPLKVQSKKPMTRSIRPREPEMLPPRFAHRPGPALVEPFKSVLDEHTLVRRAVPRACGWKGCDAVLGSEALIRRHVDFRQHIMSAHFQTGTENSQTLWRCHWRACEGPCFESEDDLSQHVAARHVSRVLDCPYKGCDLDSPNVSHLSRHVMKQHEEDEPRPLADLSVHLGPPWPLPEQALPEVARTDELTTPRVPGSRYGSELRREWARLRVQNNCFGGDNPIIHVEHPPHMLQTQGEDDADPDDSEDEERLYEAVAMAEERLLDKAEGRRSRWEVVVELPTRRELARRAVVASG